MLERVWRKGNPLTLLVGMQTSTATMENSVEIPLKTGNRTAISSVQFSRSVVSNSLRTHELQHARPPCPSPTPGVHSDSRPSSQWCHPPILSSVVPFWSCPQSLPASESLPVSQLLAWRGQSTGAELPYDPAIPLLGIHTEETRTERDTCTPMFIAALFIIARTWKQPRCPSAD